MRPSHRKFCNHFLKNGFNATDAAKKAGYRVTSDESAQVIGSRLLRNVMVKEYLAKRIDEAIGSNLKPLQVRVLEEIQQEAFSDSVFYDETKGGTVTRPNSNKLKALELLAKYSGLLGAGININVDESDDVNVVISVSKKT